MKYHIRVFDLDGLHWTEMFATDDFDDALAEWFAESEENPRQRVELVEETILEVSDP